MQGARTYRWRRLDWPGLEVLQLAIEPAEITARSTVLDAGPRPFGLRYLWTLDPEWRTRALLLQLDATPAREMLIERRGPTSWRVDGVDREDLAGCEEIDVSATPFCNLLGIHRLGHSLDAVELTALYVALPDLTLVPSRQRYERLGPREVRYVDLGANAGFSARLKLDADGFVENYEGLFEAIAAG